MDVGSALMWGLAWVVVAIALATVAAAWASGVSALIGFFVGRQVAKTKVRTPVVVTGVPLTAMILTVLSRVPSQSPLLARLFPSPESLTLFTDVFVWGIAAFTVVALLQLMSNRYPSLISLEVIVVALFLSAPFAAHRDGYINRPYFLVDPLWSRGYDPVPILQIIGLICAVALVLLTIGRATERSSILDLVILCFIAFGLYLYIPQSVIKDMVTDPPASSGLTGKPSDGQESDGPPTGAKGNQPMSGSSGQGSGSSNSEPFPFEASEDKPKPQPVAVVVFKDDYDSPDGYYYFRQTAFSQYNGFRLVKDTTGKADLDLFRRFPVGVEKVDTPPLRLEVPTRRLKTRVALISSHTEPFGLVSPVQMVSAQNPNIEQFERAYDVESQVYGGDYSEILMTGLRSPLWSQELVAHYLAYPDKDPRYKKLADKIVSSIDPQYRDYALAKALAITLYLGEHGKYTTKKRAVNGSEDPTADFLFGDMTGYCVHFSHSAVYLMRAAGIPARVGAGYAVETRNRRGSALLILSSTAHAWPEVWIDGIGWYPLDVAPQTNLDTAEPPPDFDLQAMLAEMARNEGTPTDPPKEFDIRKFLRMLIAMGLSFLPWVIVAGLILLYGFKIERRLAPRLEKGEHEKIDALYRAALDRLSEVGVIRGFGQGRLTFSRQWSDKVPSFQLLTRSHLVGTFGKEGGSSTLESASLPELYEAYRRLGTEIAQMIPLWRRVVGWLNPVSWLWTK